MQQCCFKSTDDKEQNDMGRWSQIESKSAWRDAQKKRKTVRIASKSAEIGTRNYQIHATLFRPAVSVRSVSHSTFNSSEIKSTYWQIKPKTNANPVNSPSLSPWHTSGGHVCTDRKNKTSGYKFSSFLCSEYPCFSLLGCETRKYKLGPKQF